MNKPTKEEYEKAVEEYKQFEKWLELEVEKQNKLLDELIHTRSNIRGYEQYLEKRKEIIQKYQIYEEIENEQN